MSVCVFVGEREACGYKVVPVELIIPILTHEGGRKEGWRWWWDAVAANSRLINNTLACGNILPKYQLGPCEATHLSAPVQQTQAHIP